MIPEVERAYLREIAIQADYVQRAAQRAAEVRTADFSEFFREMVAMLSHAAAVSRILWPPKSAPARVRRRGDHLRAALALQADHLLSKRDLRNHFEHFDERLDQWAEESAGRAPLDLYIFLGADMKRGQKAIQRVLGRRECLRGFNPETGIIYFRGESFDARALVAATADVGMMATQRLQEIERELSGAGRVTSRKR